jgi:hypothetical protein
MSNVPRDVKCMAVQHSDQMVCERCALRWDVNDSAPPTCQLRTQRQQCADELRALIDKE